MGIIKVDNALQTKALQLLTSSIFYLIRGGEYLVTEPWGYFIQQMKRDTSTGCPFFRLSLNTQGDFEYDVNPNNYTHLDERLSSYCLEHASMHLILGHLSQQAAKYIRVYGPRIFGLAADLAVNDNIMRRKDGSDSKSQRIDYTKRITDLKKVVKDLQKSHPQNFIRPDEKQWECDVLLPEDLDFSSGLTTAEYCELLNQLVRDHGQQILNQGNDRDEQFNEQLADKLKKAGVKFGSDGKPIPGQKLPKGLTDQLINGLPQGMDVIDNNPADAQAAENKAAGMLNALERDFQTLKSRGLLPDEALDFIKSLQREAKVSWTDWLRNCIASAISENKTVSIRRLNRRQPEVWFGRKTERTVVVKFLIDTSGSMGVKELRCVEAEVKGLVDKGAKVYIINSDCRAGTQYEFKKGDKIDRFFGGGGTEFAPALKAAEENDPPPDAVVYFTDGYGERINSRPPFKSMLWVLTDGGMDAKSFQEQICPWGDVVVLETDGPEEDDSYGGRTR